MVGKKNILVVGGTGFIGSYVVKNLATNLDLSVSVIHHDMLANSEKISGVNYYQIDLVQPSDKLNEILELINVLIWLVPKAGMLENVIKNVNIKKLEKVVYTSTMLIYPDSKVLQNESIKPEPISDYEKGKVSEENYLINFFNNSSVKICIARISNVYGDIKNKDGRVTKIIEKIQSGEKYTINGDGSEMRDYIFVEDVADMLQQLIFHTQSEPVSIFNLCTGVGTLTIDLVRGIENFFGKELKFICDTNASIKNNIGDNSKILHISGYKLKYSLASGLAKTYQNYSIN